MSTLFSYFKPLSSGKKANSSVSAQSTSNTSGRKKGGPVDPSKDGSTPTRRKRPRPLIDSDSDDKVKGQMVSSERKKVARGNKRRRTLDSDEDDSDEYIPENDDESPDKKRLKVTPQKLNKPSANFKTPQMTPTSRPRAFTPSQTPRASTPSTPLTPHTSAALAFGQTETTFVHDKLDWLKENKRRDQDGRCMTDPDYNPRTLKVPKEFLDKLTPAFRQWWEIKRNHFDNVLMFKVGKFYELYHMDAVVGVKELGLVFMKGEFAHSGFPEIGFGKYSQSLVQKGYKIARVEQTETPAMMEERVKRLQRANKFDKVVRREVCSVITKGTCTLGYQDRGGIESESLFLTAIKEEGEAYGVCFIDTSIGTFHLGQFEDDHQGSRLRTVLAHHPSAHILHERGGISPRTAAIFNQLLASTLKDGLSQNSEFWNSEFTLNELSAGGYFKGDDSHLAWPDVLESMMDKEDGLVLRACQGCDLAVSALGACIWYLRRCLIDHDLLSLKSFKLYTPLDAMADDSGGRLSFVGKRMILDDITLKNLDILDNCGRSAGTLLERIDQTVTAFGKRLLRQWVCAPLCDPAAVSSRLDALSDLISHAPLIQEIKNILKKLPDLERLLRKIHTLGSPSRSSSSHPDARAILYEQTTYSKRKISDFISILEGFEHSRVIVDLCEPVVESFNSMLLRKLVTLKECGGSFPNLSEQLKFFGESFNQSEARKAGVIVPSPGVNSAYDRAISEISKVENQLEEYLHSQKKLLRCRSVVFWGNGRNRFQLEVPEAVSRSVPDEYELKSQKKGFRRYWTSEIERLLAELVRIEGKRDDALKDTMRCLFNSFDQHFSLWQGAVDCLAVLDTLLGLAVYSSSSSEMCRPEIVPPLHGNEPFLEIIAGHHPCIVRTYQGDEFIPNDMCVSSEEGRLCVVVTGPNMGGKSTLMRQTGLIVILAHLGCYVPAESCRLSPVDRMFTRLGASDRIMSGESTFFVELTETATILKHATRHSLVLLDELGRGTATYDGTAIAGAVVTELAEGLCCRTLFSTHYHSLVDELSHNPHVRLGHMACMVEEGVVNSSNEEECGTETITFLYKFVQGACPKSYGFNAAQLAGLPYKVVSEARRKAAEFERSAESLKMFRHLFTGTFKMEGLASFMKQMD